jgi:hypothetical protein
MNAKSTKRIRKAAVLVATLVAVLLGSTGCTILGPPLAPVMGPNVPVIP